MRIYSWNVNGTPFSVQTRVFIDWMQREAPRDIVLAGNQGRPRGNCPNRCVGSGSSEPLEYWSQERATAE